MSGYFARDDELRRQDQLLRRHARRVARSEADAEDAVQEAWLRSLEREQVPEHSLESWLRVVVSRSALRIRWRERARQLLLRDMERPVSAPSVLCLLDEHGSRERAERLIARLDEPYRMVLRMRFLEDLSPAEIAVRLARPEVTVRSQLKRGLDRLRTRVDGERRLAALAPGAWRRLWQRWAARPALAGLALVGATLVGALLFFFSERAQRPADAPVGLAMLSETAAPLDAPLDRHRVALTSSPPSPTNADAESNAPSAAFAEGLVHCQGRAVGHAEIWASRLLEPPIRLLDTARLLGKTDADGHYRVALLDGITVLWAEEVHREPDGTDRSRTGSQRYALLDLEPGACASIDLELLELSRIRGVVEDAHGLPVSGARVSRAQALGDAHFGAEGVFQRGPLPAWTTTDDAGRFELPVLSPGVQDTWVELDGRPVWTSRVSPTDELTIRLPALATVVGRVLSPAGTPVAGCDVRLQLPGQLPELSTRTDEAGNLRFEGLPPRLCTLSVLPEQAGLSAIRRFECAAGEVFDVGNVVLTAAASITGRARRDGLPLSGWRVVARSALIDGLPDLVEVVTDAEGAFEFKARSSRPHDLFLLAPDDLSGAPWASLRSVRPGGEVQLNADQPSGVLSVRTSGFGTRPRLALRATHIPAGIQIPLPGSGVLEQRLPPGCYDAALILPGLGELSLPAIELAENELLYVDVEPPATGGLEVRLALPGTWTPSTGLVIALEGCGLACQFVPGSPAKTGVLDVDAGSLSLASLLPGSYQLTARSPALGLVRREVSVVAGETTWLDVPLEPGDPVTVSFDAERPLRDGETLELALCSLGLELEESVTAPAFGSGREGVYQIQHSLAHGDYALEVQSTGGLHGSLRFSVPGENRLALLLRERPPATR